HIVQEFSDFARLPRPELVRCDIAELVRDAVALYGAGAIRLRVERPDGAAPAPVVRADREQLRQALLNLLADARDAQAGQKEGEGKAGEIVVRVSVGEGEVRLEVADTGIGFDETVRERLFAPYFTTKANGTGLGLAIVQRIVTDHGGHVSARGEPGGGAVFTV